MKRNYDFSTIMFLHTSYYRATICAREMLWRKVQGLVSSVLELGTGEGRMQPLRGFSSLGWDPARDNLSKDKASRDM